MNYRGMIDIPQIWYSSLNKEKKNKLDKKIRKDWHVEWEDCSETLKLLIYQKERGR